MGFLVKGLNKINVEGRFTGFKPGNMGQDGFYGKNAHGPINPGQTTHKMASGIVIHN